MTNKVYILQQQGTGDILGMYSTFNKAMDNVARDEFYYLYIDEWCLDTQKVARVWEESKSDLYG